MNDWIKCSEQLPETNRKIEIKSTDGANYAVLDSDDLLNEDNPRAISAVWRYYQPERAHNYEQPAPNIKVLVVNNSFISTVIWCVFISIWLLAGEPSMVDAIRHALTK